MKTLITLRCIKATLAVIWRKNYFGTRSDYGSDFVARTTLLITSCRLEAKNPFDICLQILTDYFLGQKSLVFAHHP